MGKKQFCWCMGLVLPFVAIGCNSQSDAPAVVGARALSSKEILVEFAEPAGSVADVVANYLVQGPDSELLAVHDVDLNADRTTVTLTTDDQQVDINYSLEFAGGPIITVQTFSPPRVVGAVAINNTTMIVTFNKKMGPSAQVASNNAYRIRLGSGSPNNIYLHNVEEGKHSSVASSTFTGTSVAVKIKVNGTSIKVWIDGTLKINATHSVHSAGGVAFGGDQPKFDNLKIFYDDGNESHGAEDDTVVDEDFEGTSITYTHDDNGNLITGPYAYTYDAWSRATFAPPIINAPTAAVFLFVIWMELPARLTVTVIPDPRFVRRLPLARTARIFPMSGWAAQTTWSVI